MTDAAVLVAVRFVLYAALGAAFGLALFKVPPSSAGEEVQTMRGRHRRVLAVFAAVGLVVSATGFVALAKAMADADTYGEAIGHAADMVFAGLPVAIAWVVRSLALVACVGLTMASRDVAGTVTGLKVASGVALASLAWSGHGAMHEGFEGILHLTADVAHLWAAGAWVGALVAFLMLAVKSRSTQGNLGLLATTTENFAKTGTVVVAVLVGTGVVNIVEIVGPTPAAWLAGIGTLYGQLLFVKVLLFVGMLVLAAANRWRLSPRLARARASGDALAAAQLLRTSLVAEVSLALLVLAVVAWLGTLSPTGH